MNTGYEQSITKNWTRRVYSGSWETFFSNKWCQSKWNR